LIDSFFTNTNFAFTAAAVALAAATLIFFVYRSITGRRLQLPRNGRPRPVRLGIVDAFRLDRKRQLVIVRRDSVEHLLLIGGPNDLLIESQIVRSENRESRSNREAKVRDWEPRESALLAPAFAAGEELAASPTEAPGREKQKFDPAIRQDQRYGKDRGHLDDAATSSDSVGPLPAHGPNLPTTAAKSVLPSTPIRRNPRDVLSAARTPAREGSSAGPGELPANRESPTLRPLAERQPQSKAPQPPAPLRVPEGRPEGSNGLRPRVGKEVFAAPDTAGMADVPRGALDAAADALAPLSLGTGTRTAPRIANAPQGLDSLEQEIARILGREQR